MLRSPYVAVSHQGHGVSFDGEDPVQDVTAAGMYEHDVAYGEVRLLAQDHAVPSSADEGKHAVAEGRDDGLAAFAQDGRHLPEEDVVGQDALIHRPSVGRAGPRPRPAGNPIRSTEC